MYEGGDTVENLSSSTECSSVCSSLNVRYQVLHPYRTTGKIIVLYILMFMFYTANEKAKGSGVVYIAKIVARLCIACERDIF
jgi:hypothetical protein